MELYVSPARSHLQVQQRMLSKEVRRCLCRSRNSRGLMMACTKDTCKETWGEDRVFVEFLNFIISTDRQDIY